MPKIRVLVVDDAVVVRSRISKILCIDPGLEVVGVAANGRIALAKIPQVNPDIVILDIEMPEMDGLQTLSTIRQIYPHLPVIMFSTSTRTGAIAVILTGIGQDGLHGYQCIREAGGQVLAQDKASSVVWGMPSFVVNAGLADQIVTLDQMASEIMRSIGFRDLKQLARH
ncbi:response regulator [Nostoc sp. UCD121]|uniref:response regulator n=1 Tax=unclassified Nostoc TaxID=2593658 RepID=UPI0016283F07|nr:MULTISPECIES: response regulator [unclassified Nostoc]MBC1224724.1 response regulator [Nostoc sp. UCD120]MBC1280010.1 response regulator [Nostoc sp. UCD121]MBC1298496.1 response regulator [Nostoc sp. UCD122]